MKTLCDCSERLKYGIGFGLALIIGYRIPSLEPILGARPKPKGSVTARGKEGNDFSYCMVSTGAEWQSSTSTPCLLIATTAALFVDAVQPL